MSKISTELLVIGGGVTGLGIAWDACLRGLKVIVIDQGDLGQGTSGRYHGLLHSGGRYVISDPPSARDCASENTILRHIVPHTIEDTGGFFISAPADPTDFPDRWCAACQKAGVQVEEIEPLIALKLEPAINPRISRAFRVNDASLDSFDLLHALAKAIQDAGGQVWLRHRLEAFVQEGDRVSAAKITNEETGRTFTIGAELTVNAAGPWARMIANLADIHLPIVLGKGTMVAMAHRPVHTILNRCKPPSDGDIIVPIGTVAVLGTTDIQVESPTSLTIEPWEIDFLLAQGEVLIPGLTNLRPLRAWAGIRPLYAAEKGPLENTRELPRGHTIIDHSERDGLKGLITIFGGKLTTFRLMAEQTVNLISEKRGIKAECRTADTPIQPSSRSFQALPSRFKTLQSDQHVETQQIVCECELVTRSMVEEALLSYDHVDLDAIRRDLRLGMGPCQAGFCAYRAAGIAYQLSPHLTIPDMSLLTFLQERWRGMRPLSWGYTLRQMEFTRRIYLELLGLHRFPERTR
jgi:glycerol-3-phosphate dehydrogenase